jgi:hypothetical protein
MRSCQEPAFGTLEQTNKVLVTCWLRLSSPPSPDCRKQNISITSFWRSQPVPPDMRTRSLDQTEINRIPQVSTFPIQTVVGMILLPFLDSCSSTLRHLRVFRVEHWFIPKVMNGLSNWFPAVSSSRHPQFSNGVRSRFSPELMCQSSMRGGRLCFGGHRFAGSLTLRADSHRRSYLHTNRVRSDGMPVERVLYAAGQLFSFGNLWYR